MNSNYIDGFVLPIPKKHIDEYQNVAGEVAKIWKEHGALEYFECVGDEMNLAGTVSFLDLHNAREDEVIIFGWAEFESKEARDQANKLVFNDPRMPKLVGPLTDPSKLIFNAERMVYGGFRQIV